MHKTCTNLEAAHFGGATTSERGFLRAQRLVQRYQLHIIVNTDNNNNNNNNIINVSTTTTTTTTTTT
jgi:hypothetical protein